MTKLSRWLLHCLGPMLLATFLYACVGGSLTPTPNRILLTGTIGTTTPDLELLASSQTPPPPQATWPTLALTLLPAQDLTAAASLQPTRNTYPPQKGFLAFAAWSGSLRRIWIWADNYSPFAITPAEDDAHDPELNHTGQHIVYTSRHTGNWEIYMVDLSDGTPIQLTHSSEFVAHPTWSPDSQFVAYEHFMGGHFQICILPISGSAPNWCGPNNMDSYEPQWASQGRTIVFTGRANQKKQTDIYALDLNSMTLRDLTNTDNADEHQPAFSPDSTQVAYGVTKSGYSWIETVGLDSSAHAPSIQVQGDRPTWSVDGAWLAGVSQPNALESYLLFYPSDRSVPYPPARHIAARVDRISWSGSSLSDPLPPWLQSATQDILPAPVATPTYGGPQTHALTRISATAQDPRLSDAVTTRFADFRNDLKSLAGWDYLNTLDSAVVSISTPLAPGDQYSWLRTGRAFAIARDGVAKGWLKVVPESQGSYTYWRLYLRAAQQDGTQGEPMRDLPWDFSARTSTDPAAVNQGGMTIAPIPAEYYVDLTQIAAAHGWEREPADANWRTYYPGIRYWEFVCSDGLSWFQAMNEVYPLMAFLTATPSNTPTAWPTYNWGPRPTDTQWPSPTLKYP
jgi:TolB protein